MRQSAVDLVRAEAVLKTVRDHAESDGSMPWPALRLWMPAMPEAQLERAVGLCVRAVALERCDVHPEERRWRPVQL
jgi:hypothetical protein